MSMLNAYLGVKMKSKISKTKKKIKEKKKRREESKKKFQSFTKSIMSKLNKGDNDD